ncbi:MAG: phosphatidate cytidylyltransferase, partial [Candidatus Aminicenantales bacterium]
MNLRQRLPIAIVMLAVVVICVQFLPLLGFFIVLEILILSSLLEFYHLFRKKNLDPQVAVGCLMALIIGFSFFFDEISLALALFLSFLFLGIFYVISINKLEKLASFPASIGLTFLGAVYLSFTLNYFFLLKKEKGAFYIYFFLAVIFLGDTGAYFFGKLWGRRKFLPIASPHKTWEGCLGG